MPTGWSGDPDNTLSDHGPDPTSVVQPARCAALFEGIDKAYWEGKAKSYVTFVSGGAGALVGFGVSSSDAVVPDAFAASSAALSSCARFKVVDGKDVQTVTAAPLSVPELGEEHLAIRFSLASEAFLARYDALRVRVGHNVIIADEFAPLGSRPRTARLVAAARTTLSNLAR